MIIDTEQLKKQITSMTDEKVQYVRSKEAKFSENMQNNLVQSFVDHETKALQTLEEIEKLALRYEHL